MAWTPRYIYVGTPNTSGLLRLGTKTGLGHGTRGAKGEYGYYGNRSEGLNTVRYCTTPGTTSYGFIIDFDGTIYELAGWRLQAWHATYLNSSSVSFAVAQANAGDPLTEAQHKSVAWLVREAEKRGIPLRKAAHEADAGWIEHQHTAQGRSWGKNDIGTLDWSRVL